MGPRPGRCAAACQHTARFGGARRVVTRVGDEGTRRARRTYVPIRPSARGRWVAGCAHRVKWTISPRTTRRAILDRDPDTPERVLGGRGPLRCLLHLTHGARPERWVTSWTRVDLGGAGLLAGLRRGGLPDRDGRRRRPAGPGPGTPGGHPCTETGRRRPRQELRVRRLRSGSDDDPTAEGARSDPTTPRSWPVRRCWS